MPVSGRNDVDFSEAVELAGKGMDTAGVAVLVIGAVLAAVRAAQGARGQQPDTYRHFRQ